MRGVGIFLSMILTAVSFWCSDCCKTVTQTKQSSSLIEFHDHDLMFYIIFPIETTIPGI